jgi:hypothetical protein
MLLWASNGGLLQLVVLHGAIFFSLIWNAGETQFVGLFVSLETRVARFFMAQYTKTGENIPNNQKIT